MGPENSNGQFVAYIDGKPVEIGQTLAEITPDYSAGGVSAADAAEAMESMAAAMAGVTITEEVAGEGLAAISQERKDLVLRLRRATFAYTREYLNYLDKKEQEEIACKEAKEAYEKDGVTRCLVLTAENNAKVMLDCMKDMKQAIEILENREEDVDEWMIAGIVAMLDKANEMKIIPFDLPTSICGLLCAQYR